VEAEVAGAGVPPRRSVISKVVAIIRSFGSGRSLTVTEIAHVADLPLSTTHRLVHELAAWGILHRGIDTRYQMALPPLPCGCGGCPPSVRTVAAPVLEDLSAATRSEVRLGLLDGLSVSYLEKAPGCQPTSSFSPAARLPAHATALGKALLAFSAPETVEHVIQQGLRRYTSSTLTTAARLRHALKVTRLRGVAFAIGELAPDYSAVGAPVFAAGGEVIAAAEVRLRDVPAELPGVIPALTVVARTLSRELARTVPPSVPDHRAHES
jgi:DNA-binding IclR family transcriptional regulator